MKRLLALLLVLFTAGPAFGQAVVQTDNVRAELLSDVAAVKPGEPFWVGLRQTMRPKWHTYWKNPGESGLPTEITWTLPPGVTADPIVWPVPHVFDIGGVINYGFKDDILLLVRITPPANSAAARSGSPPKPTGWCAKTSASPRTASSSLPCRSRRPRRRAIPRRARCSRRPVAACRWRARGPRATASPSPAIRRSSSRPRA